MEITIKIYEDNTACTVSSGGDISAGELVDLFLRCAIGVGFSQSFIIEQMKEVEYV